MVPKPPKDLWPFFHVEKSKIPATGRPIARVVEVLTIDPCNPLWGSERVAIVEIFPPPGHTGVWCSGNTPSLALCNEESCGSIPSMTDSFYENANMADTCQNLPFTISVRDIHFIMLLIPSLTKLGFCLSFFGFCLL